MPAVVESVRRHRRVMFDRVRRHGQAKASIARRAVSALTSFVRAAVSQGYMSGSRYVGRSYMLSTHRCTHTHTHTTSCPQVTAGTDCGLFPNLYGARFAFLSPKAHSRDGHARLTHRPYAPLLTTAAASTMYV